MTHGWPRYSQEALDAVVAVIQSGKVNYWTGQEGKRFEAEFRDYWGAAHAVGIANGTVTLELALRASGVGPGDEVIVTPRSFFASASVIQLVGATPVFADVDRDSQNLTAATIEPLLTKRTRAILPVHLAGWPCEIDEIVALADSHDAVVIEDCAQAHGAKYKGQHVGTFGQFGSFSFCQDKIMSTGGEGGMLLVKNERDYEFVRSFKDHGKNFEKMKPRPGRFDFHYVHDSFGTNYRMTEMQSAIGRVQLRKLDDWIEQRRTNALRRLEHFSSFDIVRAPVPADGIEHAYYKLYVFVEPDALHQDWSRDRLVSELNSHGVKVFTGSCPEIYREQAFGSRFSDLQLPVAHELGETSLMFLVDPTIDQQTIDRDGEVLKDVLARARR
ncbi:MAG: DegT/DnrJ/EryC1/StrS family aminotransferase [Pseudomonadota bacterium]